jgi:hypothetical protein
MPVAAQQIRGAVQWRGATSDELPVLLLRAVHRLIGSTVMYG